MHVQEPLVYLGGDGVSLCDLDLVTLPLHSIS